MCGVSFRFTKSYFVRIKESARLRTTEISWHQYISTYLTKTHSQLPEKHVKNKHYVDMSVCRSFKLMFLTNCRLIRDSGKSLTLVVWKPWSMFKNVISTKSNDTKIVKTRCPNDFSLFKFIYLKLSSATVPI